MGNAGVGPRGPFVAGFTGAGVVTFFTFLPTFILIFMGAPFIETPHGEHPFTAPLKAITAAVVGGILNLAVFFAYSVVWPQGLGGDVDWFSMGLIITAVTAMFRGNTRVKTVLLPCTDIGYGLALKIP